MTPFNRRVLSSTTRVVLPVAVYPGAKLIGKSEPDVVRDATLQCQASLALRAAIGLDVAQSAMDLSAEAEAFGATVRFMHEAVPTVTGRLVTDAASIAALTVPKVGAGRTQVFLDTVRLLAGQSDKPFVMGGCIGPFTLAGRLFGVSESLEFSLNEPEAMHELIEKATTFLIAYARAFKAAGANALFVAEPTAGLLSPAMLGRFSSVYVKRLVDALQDDTFGFILHNCAARIAHIPQVLASGATAFHFGQPMDMAAAAQQVPAEVVICGNLDPTAVFNALTPAALAEKTRSLATSVKGKRNVVLSSGCDVPPTTSVENLRTFISTGRAGD